MRVGVQTLDTPCGAYWDPSQHVVIFCYSQGAVVSDELRNLGDLTPAQRAQLQVVTIGNADNPDGGIFTRLEKFGDAVVVTPPRRASGR